MFTGIITQLGTIESSEKHGDLRVTIACGFPMESIGIGDSIACNGACLTVVAKTQAAGKTLFTTELSAETVQRTAPGQWEHGQKVNLERAMRLGDALDGHMVTGHIDGIARIVSIEASGDSHIVTLEAPETLARFIAEKGSVTLDGVSLTVNGVRPDKLPGSEAAPLPQGESHIFTVNIIPHTWQVTTLGSRKAGDMLNMEIDLIARYVARLLEK